MTGGGEITILDQFRDRRGRNNNIGQIRQEYEGEKYQYWTKETRTGGINTNIGQITQGKEGEKCQYWTNETRTVWEEITILDQ